MIVQVRGASGSGKSTLVRSFFEERGKWVRWQPVPAELAHLKLPQKRPYAVSVGDVASPGHYDRATGGCDCITQVDDVYALVQQMRQANYRVLMEGLFVSKDARRLLEQPVMPVVLFLDADLDLCRESVAARQAAAGREVRPLKKLESDWREVRAKIKLLRAAGVTVEDHTREGAAARLRELFS